MNGFAATLMGLVLVAGLSACSSDDDDEMMGGGDPVPSFDQEAVIDLTDADEDAPGADDLKEILERGENIILGSAGNDVKVATAYVESTNLDVFTPGTYEAECTELECTITDPLTNEKVEYDFSDVDPDQLGENFGVVSAVLTKSGITTVEAVGGDKFGSEARLYGSWLNESAFAVLTQSEREVGDGDATATVTVRTAFAGGGNLTGSRPDTDATWNGLMVGTPAGGPQRNDILQGDAELTFTAADNMIDATFSKIHNLDQGEPYRTRTIEFSDVPVDTDGTYSLGDDVNNRINGAFYGTNQAETTGTFAKDRIVGAFGAIKEQPATQ